MGYIIDLILSIVTFKARLDRGPVRRGREWTYARVRHFLIGFAIILTTTCAGMAYSVLSPTTRQDIPSEDELDDIEREINEESRESGVYPASLVAAGETSLMAGDMGTTDSWMVGFIGEYGVSDAEPWATFDDASSLSWAFGYVTRTDEGQFVVWTCRDDSGRYYATATSKVMSGELAESSDAQDADGDQADVTFGNPIVHLTRLGETHGGRTSKAQPEGNVAASSVAADAASAFGHDDVD